MTLLDLHNLYTNAITGAATQSFEEHLSAVKNSRKLADIMFILLPEFVELARVVNAHLNIIDGLLPDYMADEINGATYDLLTKLGEMK